jgi:hypothetical protein
MNRRTFLQTAAGTGIAAALPSISLADGQSLSGSATRLAPQTPLPTKLSSKLSIAEEAVAFQAGTAAVMRPPASSHYFTQEALTRALGVETLKAPTDIEVVAYNFPGWHPSPFMEARFGKGWTEYETLKNSRPLFPGHLFPKYPLWGYFDESDPEWAAKEIEAAADHGLDAWMIDWYWHDGTMFYQEQLEQGFLKAPNRSRLKFAIMWANHDWKNVYPARRPEEAAVLLPQTHSVADFRKVTRYCLDRYFHQPNYWRIDGALVFAIFDLGKIIDFLGEDGLKRSLDEMRKTVQAEGLGEVHVQSSNGLGGREARLKELGVDSATEYHPFSWTYTQPGGFTNTYGEGAAVCVAAWKRQRAICDVPFFPDCPVGFDDSPRFGMGAHPAVNRSPDQFERLVRGARHLVADDRRKIVYISAWNEWTEDHVLLPDTIWGYSYLEALKRAARG